jgi:hypothetical protein
MAEKPSDDVYDDAYELYQEIRDNRGLHLREEDGRDDELYQELRELIGCYDQTIADFLREEDRSADWLLGQFLQLAAPFASMFTDIWDFLSNEHAPKATEDLRVEFGFDKGDITEVDLDQFREWAETARKISLGANVAYWSRDAAHELFELARCVEVENQYESEYRRGESYELPVIETHHGDEFESYVRRIRNLFQHAIDVDARNNNLNNGLLSTDTEDFEMPLPNIDDFLPAWEPIFNNHHMVSDADRRQAEAYFRENIAPKLEIESIVASLDYQSPLDILRLPFWEHRWHTYEIWMTIQTLKALDKYDPQVRITDGRIPIDGRDEAVVADLERIDNCAACVVSEFRTPYNTDEREAIQPDLSICRKEALNAEKQPISTAQLGKESRVAIVEYKQHEKLSPAHAEERAHSYLDGSPEAVGLVMVNYDEATDVDFPDQAELIGNVRPNSPTVREYRELLQTYIEEVELFDLPQQWTVLVDVSASMGDIYTDPDVTDALLNLLDMDGARIEMYTFNSGLTQNSHVSESDIEAGLQTRNGTNIKAALTDLQSMSGEPENLLVVTDGDYTSTGSLPVESEITAEIAPKNLSTHLDSIENEIEF